MAEERIDTVVSPERTMLEDSNMRNSTGKNSTSSIKKKILPTHYLRPSTGSCHDLCKYGRKHSFEAKGTHRILRSFSTTMAKVEDSVNSAIVSEGKKKPAIKRGASLDSKIQSHNNTEIKFLPPHYLRASTGSRHDFCKYGREHASEAKGMCHILRSFSTTVAEGEDSVNSAIVSERKKKPAIKCGASLDLKIQSSNNAEIIKEEDPSSGKKKEASPKKAFASPKQALSLAKQIEVSPRKASALAKKIEVAAKKVEVSRKQALSPAKKNEVSREQALSPSKKTDILPKHALSPAKKLQASTKQTLPPAKKHTASAKPGCALKPKYIAAEPFPPSGLSSGVGGKRNSDCKIVKKLGTCKIDEKKALRMPIASVSPKPSFSRVLSINTKKYRNVKAVSPRESQNMIKKAEPKLSNPVKEKTLYAIEQPESQSLEPAESHTTRSFAASSSSSSSSSSPSSSLSSPSSSLSLNSSSFQSFQLQSSNVEEENEESEAMISEADDSVSEYDVTPLLLSHVEEENVELEAIISEADDSVSEYDVTPLLLSHVEEESEESESMISVADDCISEYDDTKNGNHVETSNVEDKEPGWGAAHPENADCPPRKLKFRRGQVVDLRSENNGPRRLRFKQGRVLGGNHGKDDIGRKSFRGREVTGGDTGDTRSKSENVVPRHHDVLGKNDAEGLFNNEIKKAEPKLSNPVLYAIEQPESKTLELAQNGSHIIQTSLSLSSLSVNSISSQSSLLLFSQLGEESMESESINCEADYCISEYDESENGKQVEASNVEDKESGRGPTHPENTDFRSSKSFWRGQVVNLQSENNGPRRLKFRQGRVLGDSDPNSDIGRKSFRRRVNDGDIDGIRPESERVVLRHQDVQGKKDSQGLFNNVIEETASKLVETRKSKVKALVGAFETVISLQDSKPSTG